MNWKHELWLLTGCIFFTAASYTMLVPFLPVYLLELGVAEEQAALWSGAVFSVSFLVGGIMAPVWGKLADKKGKRLMAIRAAVGLTFVYFLGGLVTDVYQLLGMRILQGFANGFLPASMAIVSSNVPKERLGESLGIVQTGQIIGAIVGPLLGGVMAQLMGVRMSFFIAAAFLALVSVVVILFLREPPRAAAKNDSSSMLDDLKAAAGNRLLMEMLVFIMLLQITLMILQPVITLYVGQLEGSMTQAAFYAGLIFSCGGFAGAIVTPLWGRYGQQKGYFKALLFAFGGAGVFTALQYLPDNVLGFGLMQFGVGLFIVGVSPAVSAVTVNCTSPDFRGRVFGLSTTAHQIGSMLGPLLGGCISSYMGIRAVFLFTGGLLLMVAAYIYCHYLKKDT